MNATFKMSWQFCLTLRDDSTSVFESLMENQGTVTPQTQIFKAACLHFGDFDC